MTITYIAIHFTPVQSWYVENQTGARVGRLATPIETQEQLDALVAGGEEKNIVYLDSIRRQSPEFTATLVDVAPLITLHHMRELCQHKRLGVAHPAHKKLVRELRYWGKLSGHPVMDLT